MNEHSNRRLGSAFAALAMIASVAFMPVAANVNPGTSAHPALRITGIDPMQPVAAPALPELVDGILRIPLPDQRTLGISPWPAYLPQRFVQQYITASRHLHPAGPVDRIAFQRTPGADPWLIIATGARRSQTVIGEWALEFGADGWSIRKNGTRHLLGRNALDSRVVRVKEKGERWCIYLLDVQESAPQGSALAHEQEPQISWAAIRHHRGNCPAQR